MKVMSISYKTKRPSDRRMTHKLTSKTASAGKLTGPWSWNDATRVASVPQRNRQINIRRACGTIIDARYRTTTAVQDFAAHTPRGLYDDQISRDSRRWCSRQLCVLETILTTDHGGLLHTTMAPWTRRMRTQTGTSGNNKKLKLMEHTRWQQSRRRLVKREVTKRK